MRCNHLVITAILAILATTGVRASEKGEAGFTPLFNGKDLTGWKVSGGKMGVWGADKGVLFVDGRGGGWLLTEKEYSNFELRLEFKLPVHGNSGVALRTPPSGDPAYVGMEVQILDDANWKGLKPWQHTGSIYDVVAASRQVNKPAGEWNTMRIVADGRKVKVEVNGQVLVDANLDDYKDRVTANQEKKLAAHPGLARTKGHVGFQSHDGRVEFRNVQIKELGQ